MLDLEPNGEMVEIIRGPARLDGALVGAAMTRHKSGLSVLPAPGEFVPLDVRRFTTHAGLPGAICSLIDGRMGRLTARSGHSSRDTVGPARADGGSPRLGRSRLSVKSAADLARPGRKGRASQATSGSKTAAFEAQIFIAF